MSVEYSAEVWRAELPPSHKLVLLALADFANAKGEAWPSVGALSARVGVSERQIQRILRALEQADHIAIDRGRGRGNLSVYALRKGDTEGRKGDTEGRKGDISDTLCPAEKVTSGAEKVTSGAEKVTSGVIKGDTHVTQIRQDPSGTVRGSVSGPRAKKSVIPLTDGERAKLIADFPSVPEVEQVIDLALSHPAHLKYPENQYGYVRNWLRKENGNGRVATPGRNTRPHRLTAGAELDAKWERYKASR